MVMGAHWANKVGPPRVMTGFARGPALIAFYLFLISRTPHRDAYVNGWTDRRTDVSQEGTSGPKGPPRGLPSPRFISLIGARDRLTADLCDSGRFTSHSSVRTASFVAFFMSEWIDRRSSSRLINSLAS